MKQHYSEADLLETYYAQPGASMPVMMHLADCSDCAARYERLEKKVRGLAACAHATDDTPETFFARQRASIMQKIEARRSFSVARVLRVAAAVVFALLLGGVTVMRVMDTGIESPSRQVVATQTAHATRPAVPADDPATRSLDDSPWQSEELSDYHSMVAWESWVENGDQSL